MNTILILAINYLVTLINFLVIAYVILSYFVDPYHPLRMFVDRLVDPLLSPIRRVVPLIGMFDFSPFILLILVQLIQRILIQFLLVI